MAQENKVLSEIAARREEQIAKGYDAAHDDEHADGSIGRAAAAYAAVAADDVFHANALYPWINNVPKVKTKRDAMIHAAALCVAEIERMDRASLKRCPTCFYSDQDRCDGIICTDPHHQRVFVVGGAS